jgi:hypothetical protein
VAAAEIWILIFVTVSTKKYAYYERTALFSAALLVIVGIVYRRAVGFQKARYCRQ